MNHQFNYLVQTCITNDKESNFFLQDLHNYYKRKQNIYHYFRIKHYNQTQHCCLNRFRNQWYISSISYHNNHYSLKHMMDFIMMILLAVNNLVNTLHNYEYPKYLMDQNISYYYIIQYSNHLL